MPTYRLRCKTCRGEFKIWNSIHDPLPARHDVTLDPRTGVQCHGELIQVITQVATYGVGKRGAVTVTTDERERRAAKNMPAYKRLRDEGHQPVSLMGSDSAHRHIPSAYELETKATNDWEIRSGGLVSVPDDRETEINEMMADAATGDWSPIDEVHKRKAKR